MLLDQDNRARDPAGRNLVLHVVVDAREPGLGKSGRDGKQHFGAPGAGRNRNEKRYQDRREEASRGVANPRWLHDLSQRCGTD
jgi:hypothetical protein